MHSAYSAHAVLTGPRNTTHGQCPTGYRACPRHAWRFLGGTGRLNDRATGCQPLPLRLSGVRASLQSCSFHCGFGHPDIRTRTDSCTSATVARIHSAHVDSSDVRGCSEHDLVSPLFCSFVFAHTRSWCETPAEPNPPLVVDVY